MIDLDPSSPVPLYKQICEQFRRLIALGALRPGDKLPAVRELAARTRVNRNTAARAIQQLESEGIVATRVGRGTFVEKTIQRGDRASRETVVDDLLDRLLVEAQTLGFPLEELGWRLSRRIDRFRDRLEAADRTGGEE